MQLKTINLKGKEYCQVVDRLKYFNENFKDGSITTSYEVVNERIIFTAKIIIGGKVKAMGHAMKGIKREFDFEKAETRAVGRALGIFGIGADASISTYEEAREAIGE